MNAEILNFSPGLGMELARPLFRGFLICLSRLLTPNPVTAAEFNSNSPIGEIDKLI
jgi:hypothetical protein